MRLSDPVLKEKNSPFDRSLVEGPIGPTVWKLAWPTMLQNVIAGLQGLSITCSSAISSATHANAAIGVSWQIFLVVIVFMASLFTGQAVLVARIRRRRRCGPVNRTVQQAMLTALAMYAVMAPIGYFATP
jgi:Na+-driven multidrug efflux pump